MRLLVEVFGATTQSRNAVSDFGAGLKSFFGGEIKGYTKMINRSRKRAIERLKQEAEKLNADAISRRLWDRSQIYRLRSDITVNRTRH